MEIQFLLFDQKQSKAKQSINYDRREGAKQRKESKASFSISLKMIEEKVQSNDENVAPHHFLKRLLLTFTKVGRPRCLHTPLQILQVILLNIK